MSLVIQPADYVSRSLELNLFFLRIMKEHSLFLEAGFVGKDADFIKKADAFKTDFNDLLNEAVKMAGGNISKPVVKSGEIVTKKTLDAEKQTEDLSGIAIDTSLTSMELQLGSGMGNPDMKDEVSSLNERAMKLTRSLANFKTEVLNDVLSCRMFTFNFPLLIEHIRREALFFHKHLERLQMGVEMEPVANILMEKAFWDRIMAEHSMFIAHYLDPTEKDLIKKADSFALTFEKLEARAKKQQTEGNSSKLKPLMDDEIKATRSIQEFKSAGEDLILACKARSLIIPLLADHVVREADHFLRILEEAKIPTKTVLSKPKSKVKRLHR
ncbi:MAG: DUF2935 domain-containing protein [Methanomassiliicoccales archaeon]